MLALFLCTFWGNAQKYRPFTKEQYSEVVNLEKLTQSGYFSIPVRLKQNKGCEQYLYSSYIDFHRRFYPNLSFDRFIDTVSKSIVNKTPLDLIGMDTTGLQIVTVCASEIRTKNSTRLIDSIFDAEGVIREEYALPSKDIVKLLVILTQRRFSLNQNHRSGYLAIGYMKPE